MGLRTVGDPFGGPAPLIDRWLGAAWPIVKAVYDAVKSGTILTLGSTTPVGTNTLQVTGGLSTDRLNISTLPTSDAGLLPGDIWKNGDFLCVKS